MEGRKIIFMREDCNAMRVELVEMYGGMFLLCGFMILYQLLSERCGEILVIDMVIELE